MGKNSDQINCPEVVPEATDKKLEMRSVQGAETQSL